ncbi:MAG: tRNA (adenosine(37)-N6)-dimethylallyltransferase MiaA [Prevotella sp.]|nr:tRNA (adenosine(37)-N6)-dimethylallyltransferase MiaA [Prevotella sp.]
MPHKKKLIVVVGPTGVGKTEYSIQMAEELGTCILNADSRQIYSELKIGTAAPTEEQMRRVKHYFVGTHSITDYYNASIYEQEVQNVLGDVFKDKDVAILSGGSMMYIDAVCNGIDDIPTVDEETRATMKRRLSEEGLEALVEELKHLDPEHYDIVDKKNPRRVVHALEICHMTGKTYSSFRKRIKKERPYDIEKIGLIRPREEMYQRINRRVVKMIEEGLENEALKLFPMRHLNALNTVGYKEMFEYFDNNIPLDEAVRRIQSNTRRYMRKQITWFSHDNDIHWKNI